MTRHSLGRRLPLAMATLALVLAASGTAIATNGRPAVLGGKNHATRTTTLKDTQGTPLSLISGHGTPPLTVGQDKTAVRSLNAAVLGGIPASSFGGGLTVLAKPGAFTVTVPKGFRYAVVTATGGGGGGGHVTPTGSTSSQGSGGGGQGGTGVVLLPVTAGERLAAVVGSGGTLDGDGTFSSLRPATMSTSEWAVKALPGSAGQAIETCPAMADGGQGGAVLGPTGAVSALGAVGVRATPGIAGYSSTCYQGNIGAGGAGGGLAGIAGAGGDGGWGLMTTTLAAAPGLAGIVTIEFLR